MTELRSTTLGCTPAEYKQHVRQAKLPYVNFPLMLGTEIRRDLNTTERDYYRYVCEQDNFTKETGVKLSRDQSGNAIGRKKRTVSRVVTSLSNKGYLKITPTRQDGHRGANILIPIIPQSSIQRFRLAKERKSGWHKRTNFTAEELAALKKRAAAIMKKQEALDGLRDINGSLCAKFGRDINTKSSINIKINNNKSRTTHNRDGPGDKFVENPPKWEKPVVDLKNFHEGKDEACLEAEKLRENSEKVAKLRLGIERLTKQRAEVNASIAKANVEGNTEACDKLLCEYRRLDTARIQLSNAREAMSAAIAKANAQTLAYDKITSDMFFVHNLNGSKKTNHNMILYIHKELIALGCSKWKAALLCNQFVFSYRFGVMENIYGCLKLYKEDSWKEPHGFKTVVNKAEVFQKCA